MDFQKLFLTGDTRIARREFWIGIVILAVVNIVLGLVLGFVGSMIAGLWGSLILAGIASLVMTIPGYFVLVKRSNDRGYPQTYVQALVAVQIAFSLQAIILPMTIGAGGILSTIFSIVVGLGGLWALVDLGFFEGTRGPNQYGPDPLETPQT